MTGLPPISSWKGAETMPNEQRKDQDDFIVVGGKRRWFSIPGSDQRIDDLQQRIKQERSLVIPDRPSESA